MRNSVVFFLSSLLLISCNSKQVENQSEVVAEIQETNENFKEKNFHELFKRISPEEISDNVFTLVGKDFMVITAGKEKHYNSMTAGWGGFGIYFNKAASWCMLRANRYTLELIQKEQTYTLSFFSEEYKEQVMFLGSKSGRDSEKMKEVQLTSVPTPSGDMTFKEARLIIGCKLTELTTVKPDDFYMEENKDFIDEAFKEANDYHKLVFGEITHVWIRK